MRLRLAIVALAVLVVQAISAGGAASAQSVLPPGVSGANQYSETLPGGGGNSPTNERNGESPAKALGKKNAASLESLGPEGEAAARLAAESAPAGSGRGYRQGSAQKGGGAGPGAGEGASPSGSSSLKQALGQVTGASADGGMGLLLPLLIAGSVLLACVYLVNRRRTVHPQD